jgi:hypothetical protein
VGEELVGQDRRVGVDVDEVDGQGGDFGEECAAERVGEREGGGGQNEVEVVALGLYVGLVMGELRGGGGWPDR